MLVADEPISKIIEVTGVSQTKVYEIRRWMTEKSPGPDTARGVDDTSGPSDRIVHEGAA